MGLGQLKGESHWGQGGRLPRGQRGISTTMGAAGAPGKRGLGRASQHRSRNCPQSRRWEPALPGSPDSRSQPVNLNHYATKKSVAESMLDAALFMTNATRLKAVLEQGPSSNYYSTLVTLISISLLLQVVIGILLVVIARLNLNEVEKQWRLNQLNNAATTLIFITVVINVFITAFGAHKTGFLASRTSRNPL
ncbi:ninjurin-2 isoform X1 [Equus asinus]|uniref:Ninjurin 2 n=2 Tax=Equus TaxID=9789 RepID=A0A9L0KAP0_EQUAS|nr:ninjurin-2 isoform X2 [Equus asinus]